MAEPKDVKVETKIVMMTNTPVQVLKYQVPREDEIHEFKEVFKTLPLAKLLANLTQPDYAISIERYASALKPRESQ